MPPQLQERFFYHNFPRPRAATPDQVGKGISILTSICRNGLLLVPERVSWLDPTGTRPGDRTFAMQRRISFTELSPNELPGHAAMFGPFAIEYDIATLRSLGVLPVIYIPDSAAGTPSLAWSGVSLVARLADALQLIGGLAETKKLTTPTIEMSLTTRDGTRHDRHFDEREARAIRDYVALLQAAPGQPLEEVEGALRALSSVFYPTDNPNFTGALAYYRQREWRLFSGPVVDGHPTTSPASPEQQEELLAIDAEFFSRRLPFPTGEASLAEKSHYLRSAAGQHPLALATRVIVPATAVQKARETLEAFGVPTPLAVLEELEPAT